HRAPPKHVGIDLSSVEQRIAERSDTRSTQAIERREKKSPSAGDTRGTQAIERRAKIAEIRRYAEHATNRASCNGSIRGVRGQAPRWPHDATDHADCRALGTSRNGTSPCLRQPSRRSHVFGRYTTSGSYVS